MFWYTTWCYSFLQKIFSNLHIDKQTPLVCFSKKPVFKILIYIFNENSSINSGITIGLKAGFETLKGYLKRFSFPESLSKMKYFGTILERFITLKTTEGENRRRNARFPTLFSWKPDLPEISFLFPPQVESVNCKNVALDFYIWFTKVAHMSNLAHFFGTNRLITFERNKYQKSRTGF